MVFGRTRSSKSAGSRAAAGAEAKPSLHASQPIPVEAAVVAGLCVGVLDGAVTLSIHGHLFLTLSEMFRHAFASLGVAVAAMMAIWLVAWGATKSVRWILPERFARVEASTLVSAVVFFALAILAAWLLTSGRRVQGLWWRPGAILAFALLAATVGSLWLRHALRVCSRRSAFAALVLLAAAFFLDALLLRGLYPAFHWGLMALALYGASVLALSIRDRLSHRWTWSKAWRALLLAPAFWLSISGPNVTFVVGHYAPFSGKLVRLWEGAVGSGVEADGLDADLGQPEAQRGSNASNASAGIALGDASILLITVDALRADRLGAYGGKVGTPSMDALASEGIVFRRAYTPTPHTSYALSSLLTGKYLKPVLQLPDARTDHPTLAEVLRRYGYRTAAFYPPAVFFVDGERFGTMREEGWGFEYRKEMYLDARKRSVQLENYLRSEGKDHPVFAWVHLFEPHEPYDPKPPHDAPGTPAERYEGEIRVVDDAVGLLVQTFRKHRKDATVILTADHGEEFGDHGGWYHGTTLYDEQVKVPLIWSSPGVVEPGTSDAPVDLPDVATSLLSALGIPRDARMRGDDLGPLLAGHRDAPAHAFASTSDELMVVDDRYKAICRVGRAACRLYDLRNDPDELKNLAPTHEVVVGKLRAALGSFMASIPRFEAMAVGDSAWPQALARAKLGDPTVAPDLVPLLGDERPGVRAAAARALADTIHAPAAPILARLSRSDPDSAVRIEAALAALAHGDADSLAAVRDAFASMSTAPKPYSQDLAHRAAFALAQKGDRRPIAVLTSLASDDAAPEDERRRAIELLGELRATSAVEKLSGVLKDVRLRTDAARGLGAIGDPRASEALVQALRTERYLPARRAEAEALVRLGDSRATQWILHYLGTAAPLPDGVALLMQLGALKRPSGRGALIDNPSVRRGQWSCGASGCAPGADAAIKLPRLGAPRGPMQLIVRAVAQERVRLRVGSAEREFSPAITEVAYPLEDGPHPSRPLPVESSGAIHLVAVVAVEMQSELAPPAPTQKEPTPELQMEPAKAPAAGSR